MSNLDKRNFKVVMVGKGTVGKTSLCERYSKQIFRESNSPTIGAAFLCQTLEISNKNAVVTLEIWDTAGQERYECIVPMYFRGADILIAVYDITSPESFSRAVRYLQESTEYGIKIMCLCGNKADLAQRSVPQNRAKIVADQSSVLFWETSAKTGHNVNEMFYEIATHALTIKTQPFLKKNEYFQELDISQKTCPLSC